MFHYVCCKHCGALCPLHIHVCSDCAKLDFSTSVLPVLGKSRLLRPDPEKRFPMMFLVKAQPIVEATNYYRPSRGDKAREVRRCRKFERMAVGSKKITEYFKPSK